MFLWVQALYHPGKSSKTQGGRVESVEQHKSYLSGKNSFIGPDNINFDWWPRWSQLLLTGFVFILTTSHTHFINVNSIFAFQQLHRKKIWYKVFITDTLIYIHLFFLMQKFNCWMFSNKEVLRASVPTIIQSFPVLRWSVLILIQNIVPANAPSKLESLSTCAHCKISTLNAAAYLYFGQFSLL